MPAQLIKKYMSTKVNAMLVNKVARSLCFLLSAPAACRCSRKEPPPPLVTLGAPRGGQPRRRLRFDRPIDRPRNHLRAARALGRVHRVPAAGRFAAAARPPLAGLAHRSAARQPPPAGRLHGWPGPLPRGAHGSGRLVPRRLAHCVFEAG